MFLITQVSVFLSVLGLLAGYANAVIYITRTEPKSVVRVGLGNGHCVKNGVYWKILVSPSGMPSTTQTRCDFGPGQHVSITQPRYGDTGRCTDADYRDNNGSGWKFCPDSNGGGRLENMGVTPWFYRQCFPERAGYMISNCTHVCTSPVFVQIWCHDALLDWRNGKRGMITEEEALKARAAAYNETLSY